jgi:hypothetical protein
MVNMIDNLKLKAGIQDNPDQEGLDLFAQLIIQECANLAYTHNIFSRGRAWNLVIKDHFGQPIVDTDIPPYFRNL